MTNVRSLYLLAGAAAFCSCRRLRPHATQIAWKPWKNSASSRCYSESRPTVDCTGWPCAPLLVRPGGTLRGRVMAEIRRFWPGGEIHVRGDLSGCGGGFLYWESSGIRRGERVFVIIF